MSKQLADTDGDGFSDLAEVLSASDPLSSSSYPTRGVELWSLDVGSVSSNVAIDEQGTLYAGSKFVYAVNKRGEILWRYTVLGDVLRAPTLDGRGHLYVTTSSGNVYALTTTGELIWQKAGFGRVDDIALGVDNSLYIGSANDWLFKLDQLTGNKVWSVLLAGDVRRPSLGFDGFLYVATHNGHVYKLSPDDGSEVWHINYPDMADSFAIADDGTLYVVEGGAIRALSPVDGSTVFRSDLATHSSGTPVTAAGLVYAAGHSGAALVGMSESGVLDSRFSSGHSNWSTVVLAKDGTVYFSTQENSFAVGGGVLAWQRNGIGMSVNRPATLGHDGTVYLVDNTGRLHALADNSGGLADSGWPIDGHDLSHSANQCWYEGIVYGQGDIDG
ncbi:MAG: PQQ-binding-like beta-propeller repeat protein, partial [Gammaproteobacteria bacterium]